MKISKDLIYYSGHSLKIVFAKRKSCTIPARKFLNDVKPPAWNKLDRILTRLGDKDKIFNKEQFRIISDQIWEVKEGGGLRMAGYFLAGYFILTHGFKKRGGGKSSNRFPDNELKKAIAIKNEFNSSNE